ncbi:MAG: YggS family pyridoxal phosphate-dependent enzyme [Alphaproteobacteria bacterium]
MPLAENLAAIRAAIHAAAKEAGRDPGGVRLLAVSKGQPVEAIEAAYAAGQRDFGENRAQEAARKFIQFRTSHPDIRLHLIGPLQTNKAADAVRLFDVIETLDRPKLAYALAEEMRRQDRHPDLYIEVNIGHEPQKAGIAPESLADFLTLCRGELKLPVRGLMAIPPLGDDPALYFRKLAALAAAHDLAACSMGMSGDFKTAIACGATEVRIGTGIFGARNQH